MIMRIKTRVSKLEQSLGDLQSLEAPIFLEQEGQQIHLTRELLKAVGQEPSQYTKSERTGQHLVDLSSPFIAQPNQGLLKLQGLERSFIALEADLTLAI